MGEQLEQTEAGPIETQAVFLPNELEFLFRRESAVQLVTADLVLS